ncbi:MAG: tetratricopeptide repeat protein [Synechococcales bacterium]|nr:tetratricopeptide repeat protein [Synechococcales bacterium]
MAEESNSKKRSKLFLLLVSILMAGAFLVPTFLGVTPLLFGGGSSPSSTADAPSSAQRKQLEDQVRGFEAVLQREPENPIALDGFLRAKLGLIQIGAAKIDEVVPTLEKLAKINPQDTRYTMMLAQAKEQTQDLEGAAQVYRDVLKGQPGDLTALAGLSTLLSRQKRPESAIGLLQDTLRDAPKLNQSTPGTVDVMQVQIMLGKIFAQEKRYEDAIKTFDEAAKVDPKDFQPLLFKAMTFKEQGKKEEAKSFFDRALALAPTQYKDLITRSAAELNPAPASGGTPSSPSPAASPSTEGGLTPAMPGANPAQPNTSASPNPGGATSGATSGASPADVPVESPSPAGESPKPAN